MPSHRSYAGLHTSAASKVDDVLTQASTAVVVDKLGSKQYRWDHVFH